MGKWKRGLSGFLAVVPSLSAMQGDILYASAADLVEKLTAEISDGDVNGDGKTNSADVEALQTLLSSTVGSISASGKGQYDVYHDGNIDVRDLLAVQQLVDSKTPQKPEQEASGETIKLEVTDTECCPGEEVTVDVRMIDWNQDIGAIALTLDFDSSLSLKEVACTGSYQYVSDGNVLKIYGIPVKKDVYRGTVATLTFTVPDTAYGDYDVKIKDASLHWHQPQK